VGPGAGWYVQSKLSGLYQVYSVTFNKYPRPIPTPITNLRPARETCEQCHWPDKFTGEVVRTIPAHASDEANTDQSVTLQLRVGGGGWRFGGPHGIHWHTSANHRVEYIATDAKRLVIPYVRLTDADGNVQEFVTDGTDVEALKRTGQLRTMDCVDCHNRPSHRFAPNAERAVDQALQNGALPRNLPYIRREAVAALKREFADVEAARIGIKAHLEAFYRSSYAGLVGASDGRIAQAVEGTQRIYSHNVFPRMKVTWGTHPSHLGHDESPGCFRCHDEEHKGPGGRTIGQDCEACHKMRE
jgi:hypothetical protein